MKTLLSYTLYPLMLTLSVILPWWWIDAGRPPAHIVVPITALGLLAAMLSERLLPLERQEAEHGERRADLIWALITTFFSAPMGQALTALIAIWVAGAMPAGPLSGLGLRWAFMAALLISELGAWTSHWLGHKLPWWWRMHAVHHAPHRMVTLNNLRLHPGDFLLKQLFAYGPALALGASPEVMAMLGSFVGMASAFQHADAALKHGALGQLINHNHLHRWHHADQAQQANNNFGAALTVWDRLFGTYLDEGDEQRPKRLGLFDAPGYPVHKPLRAMIAPLCWGRCVRAAPRAHGKEQP